METAFTNNPRLVARPRLIDQLARAAQTRACLVLAPAGYGKSTLLRQFAGTAQARVVWAEARPAVRQPDAFCLALSSQLAALGSPVPAAPAEPREAGAWVRLLVEQATAIPTPAILVVDDFHFLDRDPLGLDVLSQLLNAAEAEPLHFLLAGRWMPQVRTARLRVKGEIEVLGKRDLAFTGDEVQAYVDLARRAGASQEEARQKCAELGGWIAGIVLTEPPHAAGHSSGRANLAEYVEDEILAALPLDLATFALQASTLHALSVQLCDHALERDDSAAMIEQLERHGLLNDDSPGETRRLEPYLTECLRGLLDPAKARDVRLRAGAFCASRQDWLTASEYFPNAEAWEDMRAVLDTASDRASRLTATLERAEGEPKLPKSLVVAQTKALIRRGQFDQALGLFSELGAIRSWPKADVELLRSWLALQAGYPQEARMFAEEALRESRLSTPLVGQLYNCLGAACQSLAQHDEAEQWYQRALAEFERTGDNAGIAHEKTHLGFLYFQTGECAQAESLLDDAVRLLRQAGRDDYLARALTNLAELRLQMNRLEDAFELIDEACQVIRQCGDESYLAQALHARGLALRVSGDMAGAQEAFRQSGEAAARTSQLPVRKMSLAAAALHVAEQGSWQEAMRMVSDIGPERQAPEAAILGLFVKIRVAWLRRDDATALELCERTAGIVEECGQVRYRGLLSVLQTAVLIRARAEQQSVRAAVEALLASPYLPFSLRMLPDASAVVIRWASAQSDPAINSHPAWNVAKRSFRAGRKARQGYPEKIEVRVLRDALYVEIDGVPHHGGWKRALDLFLYLVENPEGGKALEIAGRLWAEDGRSRLAIQQRFHSMVAALREILGADAIVRDDSVWPSEYRLNPKIALTYDLAQLRTLARNVLEGTSGPAPAAAGDTAHEMYAAPYWPARALRSPWFKSVEQESRLLLQLVLTQEPAPARGGRSASHLAPAG